MSDQTVEVVEVVMDAPMTAAPSLDLCDPQTYEPELENMNPENLSTVNSEVSSTNFAESLSEIHIPLVGQLETQVKYTDVWDLDSSMSGASLRNSLNDEIEATDSAIVPVVDAISDSGIASTDLNSNAIESIPLSTASGQEHLQETRNIPQFPSEAFESEDNPHTELLPFGASAAMTEIHEGVCSEVVEGDSGAFGSDVAELGSSGHAGPRVAHGNPGLAILSGQSPQVNGSAPHTDAESQYPEPTQNLTREDSGSEAPSVQHVLAAGHRNERSPPIIQQETGSCTNDLILHQDEDVIVARGFVVRGPYLRDINIKRTRRMWRHFRKCATCFRWPRVFMNLPCRHLCNCRECSPCMTKCSICQADIVCVAYARL